MFFVPQHCTTCRGIVLHAAMLFFMPRQENEAPWHCVASFFLLHQETMCRSIAWHSLPSFLHASARNDSLLHSSACHVMPQHNSSCRRKVPHAMATPQHLMLSFFVPQQETTCCCSPQHCVSCCSMVHHTMVLFAVPWHGASPCYCKDWGAINLCGVGCHGSIVAAISALLVVVFFAEAVFFVFFGGDNQPVWLWLCLPRWHGGLRFLCFLPWHCTFLHGILWHYFCASALFYVPWHLALCCDAVFLCFVLQHCFCEVELALFCGNVINATVLCFVSWHCAMCCFLCCGIVLCAIAFFVPWHWQCAASAVFCAAALCFVPWCCFLCHSIV